MEYNNNAYIAHSANSHGITQTMKEHSLGVSKLMRDFALSDSFADLYEFCGLIHDMGKYSEAFQKHIAGENNKVKHSIYGAIFAKDTQPPLLEIALPVFGHHSGLPSRNDMLDDMEEELYENEEAYISIREAWLKDIAHDISMPNDNTFRELPDYLQKELFIRMLYSSLIDADRLDTEKHFYERKFNARQSVELNPEFLINKLRQKRLIPFENDPEKRERRINKLRNSVRLFAESKANLPQGFFALTLPTGMGKTLCSINWALHHANYHRNIKRIIIVLPFLNIIDQTAKELTDIFNDEADYVLEHHSNVIYQNDDDEEKYNLKQLAIENWNYPIIITTSVQFFESLFNNTKSACRKLHNIQDSIIIFDEIQTLPLNVTVPTLIMLENLQILCRCSILFCTATQPDFQKRDGFSGIPKIESLVENPKFIFEATRRVTYHPLNGYNEMPISELADIVARSGKSALVVFNTKKKARLFFDELKKCRGYKMFHLSTNMCPAHRKDVIGAIRDALANKNHIIVSSTQLIEAGVDLDFPTVYRELAPLESIIQSAGRCNREGKLQNGDVYLFALTESGKPSNEYDSMTKFAKLLYTGNEHKLYTHDFYSFYYRRYVEEFGCQDEITEYRKRWLFQTVAANYKIIDNNTQSLFVINYDKSRELFEKIKDKELLTREEYQQVSQFCVQVYDKRDYPILKCGVPVWYGDYSSDYGLPFMDEFCYIL
ncbi:MAG: CRISPR-associated helicase Cas3' [Prevotella sp.]|nr:CRISPR-associated helicase Cas3' [Prevotella sp.]